MAHVESFSTVGLDPRRKLARMLVLGIPNTTLRRQVGCPECLAAIPMSGVRGVSGLLSQFLRKYWSEYHQGLAGAR